MKTYVLMLSKVFPVTHKRSGNATGFMEKILSGEKKHTIRANLHLWRKRVKEVLNGEAVISIRQWEGRPYFSRQIPVCTLAADSGIGIQTLSFEIDRDGCISYNCFNVDGKYTELTELVENDGLSVEDWKEWFRNYDLSKPLAIIHFTEFRY